MDTNLQKIREITDADVRFFNAEMGRRFRGRVMSKTGAVEMEYVAKILDTIRIITGKPLPDAKTFMENCATTILVAVYMPDKWDPQTKIEIGTHEFTHVDQLWNGEFDGDEGFGSGFNFAYLYLADEQARIRAEQRAFRSQWEVAHLALGKPLPHPKDMATILEGGYALSPESLKLAEDLAEVWITEVHYGKVDTDTGAYAINLLKTLGVVG